MKGKPRRERGSTLLESLLALMFFLVVLEASLDFFGTARAAFFKLEDGLGAREGAEAGLERIRQDALQAGLGLAAAFDLGLTPGLEEAPDGTAFYSLDATAVPDSDLPAGSVSAAVPGADDLGSGRTVLIMDAAGGQALTLAASANGTIRWEEPLSRGYAAANARFLIMRRVAYSFDAAKGVLRRKVNAASPQPLVENVSDFSLDVGNADGSISASLSIQERPGRSYGFKVLPRNLVLARKG